MKPKKTVHSRKISLRKRMALPIKGVSLMQITGVSTPIPFPMEKKNSSPVGKPATDQAVINFSASSFSSLVQEAGQYPEVRSELVDSFKARIQSGAYPSQEDISGLTNVIGGSVLQMAKSDSSS